MVSRGKQTRKMHGGKNPKIGEHGNDDILRHPNVANLDNCLVNLNDKCVDAIDNMITIALESKLPPRTLKYDTFFGLYTYGGILGVGGSTNLATLHILDPDTVHILDIYVSDTRYSPSDIAKSLGYTNSIDYVKLALDVKRTCEMYASGTRAIPTIKAIINDLRNLVFQQILDCGEVCNNFSSHLDKTGENMLFQTCHGVRRAPSYNDGVRHGLQWGDNESASYGRPGSGTGTMPSVMKRPRNNMMPTRPTMTTVSSPPREPAPRISNRRIVTARRKQTVSHNPYV